MPVSRIQAGEFTTDAEGSGLGLSVVQSIADAHDCEVRVAESEPGGARFEFVAPAAAVAAPSSSADD
ncbi:ATP-binding protein [Haloarchaeobius iranensis]|uniref:Histidine kinase-, DNA gyrase B-, and HSP90-like ATPase n=1 Tax=Haloarchaeobius iranensis TaxID=996166 RepID=A0A1G9VZ31_9EURY|nr:ATP-binding protein [Haloarchaeobius iranensis]SDM77500.1 Histidine kinase-, DNA gyrase B-, and HSP90-like ATPase [Haloarchaeobius iranensis]